MTTKRNEEKCQKYVRLVRISNERCECVPERERDSIIEIEDSVWCVSVHYV